MRNKEKEKFIKRKTYSNPNTGIDRDSWKSQEADTGNGEEDYEVVDNGCIDDEVIQKVFSPKRGAHASRNGRVSAGRGKKTRLIGGIAAGLTLAAASAATLFLHDARWAVMLFGATVITVLLFDVMEMPGRLMSTPIRVMASIAIASWITCPFVGYGKLMLLASIFTGITIFAAVFFNGFWMDSQNWLLSDSVQMILVNTPGSTFNMAWQNFGKRECRSLAHELGYEIDDKALDGLIKAFYCLGHLDADRKNIREENYILDLQDELQQAQDDYDDLEEEHTEFVKYVKTTLAKAEKALEEKDGYLEKINRLERSLGEAQKTNSLLGDANDHIVKALATSDEIREATEALHMTTDERIQTLLKGGLSVKEVMDNMGVSKHTVTKQRPYVFPDEYIWDEDGKPIGSKNGKRKIETISPDGRVGQASA